MVVRNPLHWRIIKLIKFSSLLQRIKYQRLIEQKDVPEKISLKYETHDIANIQYLFIIKEHMGCYERFSKAAFSERINCDHDGICKSFFLSFRSAIDRCYFKFIWIQYISQISDWFVQPWSKFLYSSRIILISRSVLFLGTQHICIALLLLKLIQWRKNLKEQSAKYNIKFNIKLLIFLT